MPTELTEHERRSIFAAVVAAQDSGLTMAHIRDLVAIQFGVSPEQVKGAEREGLRQGWPPLGEGAGGTEWTAR
jgi:hypothetical protein